MRWTKPTASCPGRISWSSPWPKNEPPIFHHRGCRGHRENLEKEKAFVGIFFYICVASDWLGINSLKYLGFRSSFPGFYSGSSVTLA
jgi:hypothetical protein